MGAPLAVELKATDVLRVVFNTSVDTRLTQVLKLVRGNVQTGLRAAVLRELSGDGFSHEDYRASFLYRMLPNLQQPAPPPPGDKPPKTKAPVGRNAKQQAAARLLQERRRGVQCIDIPATPPNKWERRLFLISEIFGAAEAAAVTASCRSVGGMKEKISRSVVSLEMLSEAPEAALECERSVYNVTPEEAEQRLKETEEREQEKRSVLGVHYLDDTGNPKLLFPLSGIAAVRMLSSADQKGGVTNARSQEEDEDDDCSHLTHLHHPSSTHTNILISVSYDEVTLPLWYASQKATECLDSRTQCLDSARASWLPNEAFGVFYVLAVENRQEAEEWKQTLRPAARLKGKIIAHTSVTATERVLAEQQSLRRRQERRVQAAERERKMAARASKMAEQQALLARLADGEEEEDSMQQYSDGISFTDRWDEVHATLKDLGRSVMEDASPDKVRALTLALGHGPESEDSDADASGDNVQRVDRAAQVNVADATRVTAVPALRVRRSRFTIGEAVMYIQTWARSILGRCSIRRRCTSIVRQAEELREKRLRSLGGYCTKTRRWQRFLPVTQPTPCASGGLVTVGQSQADDSAGSTHTLTPGWAIRYKIPKPLEAGSSSILAHSHATVRSCRASSSFLAPTAVNPWQRPRRRLIPSPQPPPLPPPPQSAEGIVGKGEGQLMDPAARQLLRDMKLKKYVLKMRTVEVIKELRTRALDTKGTKYHLTARLQEYLNKATKADHPPINILNPKGPSLRPAISTDSPAESLSWQDRLTVHRDALDWLDA